MNNNTKTVDFSKINLPPLDPGWFKTAEELRQEYEEKLALMDEIERAGFKVKKGEREKLLEAIKCVNDLICTP